MKALASRSALIAVAAVLSGCAALQVDVDVYKGALANSTDTQEQQLISMALSAKPLIVEYRNGLLDRTAPDWSRAQYALRPDYIKVIEWEEIAKKVKGGHGNEAFRKSRQLNNILSFYKDICDSDASYGKKAREPDLRCLSRQDLEVAGFGRGRPPQGIESLSDELARAQRRTAAPGRQERDAEAAEARRMLEEVLVDFAGRVQFFTNNQWLVQYEGSREENEDAERVKTLLETVSNTIMVQADELRREDDHKLTQLQLRANEHDAAMQIRRPSVELMVIKLRQLVDSKLKPANVVAPSSAASAASLEASQRKSLLDGLAARRKALFDALAAKIAFGNSVTKEDAYAITDLKELSGISRQELDELHASLRRGVPAGKYTIAQTKAAIDKWASERLKADSDLDAAVLALKADYRLVTSVQRVATILEVTEVSAATSRDEIFRLLRNAANVRAEQATASFKQIKSLEQSLTKADQPVTPLTLSPEAYVALQEVLKSIHPEVVSAVVKRPDSTATAGVKEEFVKALQMKLDAAIAEGKRPPELDAAIAAAKGAPLTKGPDLPASKSNDAMDVLENYIAWLRYQYLDAVASGGEEDAYAKNLAAALVQARKQRADMVYVRPSSAYLRSSLAATFAQENPSVKWSNMLNDTFQSLLRGASSKDKTLTKTREDLDKVFWQNINRVRLNAGGLTNYVIAKDDIGNWYVKGMGADPSAMINAAKNLALFNMGSRLNTNLLRADELRGKLDNDKDASEAQRRDWQTELGGINKNEGGASVSTRSGTLSSYQARYTEKTNGHLQELSAVLKSNQYKLAIGERWTTTVAPASPEALKTLMAKDSVEKLWHDATAATQNLSKDRPAADALIDALRGLEQYRKLLRATVLEDSSLVQPAVTARDLAKEEFNAAEKGFAAAQTQTQTAAEKVGKASEAFRKASADGTSEEEIGRRRSEVESAISGHQEALKNLETETGKQTAARDKLASKEAELRDAQRLRAKAASDVDVVLQTAVKLWVAGRLRVVDELETAAKVVGQQAKQ